MQWSPADLRGERSERVFSPFPPGGQRREGFLGGIFRVKAFETFLAHRQPAPNLTRPVSVIEDPVLPQVAAEIPWFHNVILIEKVKDPAQRLW
jgi:hypothetical protein